MIKYTSYSPSTKSISSENLTKIFNLEIGDKVYIKELEKTGEITKFFIHKDVQYATIKMDKINQIGYPLIELFEEKNKNFYDENKEYWQKSNVMSKKETIFYKIIKNALPQKFCITPQVNLQTIIETNSTNRNDELFRNVDFVIFKTYDYSPILAIEINDKRHYENEHVIKRDESVKKILELADIDFIDFKNEEVDYQNEKDIINKVFKTLNIKHEDEDQ